MSALAEGVVLLAQASQSESYGDLMRSGPHWLFELTLEAITAPLAFALGWLWRNRILRHLHRDLHVVRHEFDPPGTICTHVLERSRFGRNARGERCVRSLSADPLRSVPAVRDEIRS